MIRFHWDTRQIRQRLTEYAKVAGKDLAMVIALKAKRIAIEVGNLTKKTPPQQIESELGQIVKTKYTTKTGKVRNKKHLVLATDEEGNSLAAAIVNARRYKAGEPHLKAKELTRAIMKLIGIRKRSTAYLPSWVIAPIKTLSQLVHGNDGKKIDRDIKTYGVDKGKAIIRLEGKSPYVILECDIQPKGKDASKAASIINAPIQQAINNVSDDIQKYLLRKQAEAAAGFNQR